MEQSILASTKKVVGVLADDTSFDQDILTHINSAFSTLVQLGVGLPEGFEISEDDDPQLTWADFITGFPEFDPYIGLIKTCVYFEVRLAFDPPSNPAVLASMERQLEEKKGRLSLAREGAQWTDPETGLVPVTEVIEGGDAGG